MKRVIDESSARSPVSGSKEQGWLRSRGISLDSPQVVSPAGSSRWRGTFVSLGSVVGGEFLLRTAALFINFVIARVYGAATLGLYAATLAYATVAVTIFDNGLPIAAIPEIKRQMSAVDRVVTQVYCAKTLLLLPGILLFLGVGIGFKLAPAIWLVAVVLTLRTILQSYCQLQLGILKALDRMLSIGILQGIHCIFLFAVAAAAYAYAWRLPTLLGWMLGGQILEMSLEAGWLWRVGIRAGALTFTDCVGMIKRATPVGFTYTVGALILRLDVVILSMFVSMAVVGQFAAANIIFSTTYVITRLFGSVLLPEIVELAAAGEREAFQNYLRQWQSLILYVTVPASAIFFVAAPAVLRTFYGNSFAEAGRLAAVMFLATPLVFLNSLSISRAMACQAHSFYVAVHVGTLLVAILGNLLFGRFYGPMGIAVAIVLREAAMAAMFHIGRGNCENIRPEHSLV
jgi:O-antigen/teichoic acid export membrane protein